MIVQMRPIGSIRPYENNPRNNDAAVEAVVRSIREYGWRQPIVVDADGVIIVGHTRHKAAIAMGLQEVPVHVAADLPPDKARAYRIADNRVGEIAEWEPQALSSELAALEALGVEMDALGWEPDDLREAMGKDTEIVEDEPPAPLPDPVSKTGDLWILGEHRLLCGDSTEADAVRSVLAGESPHLMVTDPPYGVEYDPSWRNQAGAAKTKRTGKVLNDDRADWREAWALFPGDVAYVWHGALHAATVAESLVVAGFAIRSQIIWAKDRLVLSRGDYHWQHEPCWYAVRAKGKGHWAGDRKQTTLWQIANRDQDADTVHGTQKPVECMARPVRNNSGAGDSVYEPFSGSGTTIIACEQLGRKCRAIEIEPRYVDVAVRRWQAMTGKPAVLDGTGKTWEQVAAERGIRTVAPDAAQEPDPAPTPTPEESPDTGQRGAKPKKRAKGEKAAA